MGPLLVAWFPWFPMKEDEIGAAGSLAKGNGYQPLPIRQQMKPHRPAFQRTRRTG
jgi:hypothetical protein